jgi:hypothetical protein
MKESYDIADLFSAPPAANHVLTAAALAFNFFALIRRSFHPKWMLVITCTLALCIPVYDLVVAYTLAVYHNPSLLRSSLTDFLFAPLSYFLFAPGYLVLIVILLRLRSSRITTIVTLVSIITGWMGVTFLFFALS